MQLRKRICNKNSTRKLALLLCMLPNIALSQKDVVIFHNCENFFYPTNDTLTEDDDFTSEGRKHWTFKRYNRKKNLLAKTYMAAGGHSFPTLIGLCEIEGEKVLNDLCYDTPLRKAGYRYIHYDSHDIRGIDVALIYNPQRFRPLRHYKITPEAKDESEKTRDILYVCGMLGKLRLNIYVIHAPSRREHNAKKQFRTDVFSMVYRHIEERKSEGEEYFLLMGDMNDNPWDKSVEQGFRTKTYYSGNVSPLLVNLMERNKNKTGSYVYNGTYLSFDQFLVSRNLLNRINDGGTSGSFVFRKDFLIDKESNTRVVVPYSTYKGFLYQGGVSDHFPIILEIDGCGK